MDVNRAQEIVDSPKEFVVQLNSKEVWIDSVDSTTKTATVHERSGDYQASKTVRVDQLKEIGEADNRM